MTLPPTWLLSAVSAAAARARCFPHPLEEPRSGRESTDQKARPMGTRFRAESNAQKPFLKALQEENDEEVDWIQC